MSTPSTIIEESPRIACYKLTRVTCVSCILILSIAVCARWIGGNQLIQLVRILLFMVAVVSTMNFVIPFVNPNTILGGARLRTLALAIAAIVGFLSLYK
jgi:hypothetical protein